MCPAGLQLTLDVCILAKALQHAVVCHSALPVPLIYCHFFAVDRMASDRRIHRPPRVLHIPVHDSPVSSGNVVCFEQLCDRIVRLVIFAHNDGSGGVFIDPVDDPRAHNPVNAGKPALAVIHDGIDQRSLIMPGRRVHYHAFRLVYDQ